MNEVQKIRVGINGFGRIGRAFLRVTLERSDIEVVAINELAPTANMLHLLKYDSIHGRLPVEARMDAAGDSLIVDGAPIAISHKEKLEDLDWAQHQVDLVLESTGRFKTPEDLEQHKKAGAPKVLLSAPGSSAIKTIVLGANDHLMEAGDTLLSNASCTTNSVAPLLDIVDQLCGVEHAFITTVHSYTTDQRLQDGPHSDFRRGRAAAESIVPTSTGAAKAITRVFPKFEGRLGGAGIRVPVPDGSLTDITFTVRETHTEDEIHRAFKRACESGPYAPYLGYTNEAVVSRDIIGLPYSCLYDEELTVVLGKMVKVVGWYDNEIGYSNRLADLIEKWMRL